MSKKLMPSFHILIICLVMVLTTTAVTAKAKITVFYHGAAGLWEYNDLIDATQRFMDLNPDIEVELIRGASGWQEYIPQVLLHIASGSDIDIITPQPHWGGFISLLDSVADLSPYMEKDGLKPSDFLAGSIDAYNYNGKITGLPIAVVLRGHVYNKRMLDEAGFVPPAIDEWTWDTVIEVGRKLTIRRSGEAIPSIAGVDVGGDVRPLIFFPLATQAGGMFFDRFINPTQSLINTAPVRTALQYFMSFYQNGYSFTNRRFYNKQAAYSMDAPLVTLDYIEQRLGHTDIQFIPAAKGPVKGGFQIGVQGLQMLSSSKNPEAAWRYISYMATSLEEVRIKYSKTQREPSAYLKALPLFFNLADQVPCFEAWLAIANHPDNTPRYSLKSAEIETYLTDILTSVMKGEKALNAAIEEMHTAVQVMLDESHKIK
ncbi:MAG TPA: extracellular solute-binding protein [Firmicutes bacterium]|nr:extracellular solute-binding protein [Bacillota bacterium]